MPRALGPRASGESVKTVTLTDPDLGFMLDIVQLQHQPGYIICSLLTHADHIRKVTQTPCEVVECGKRPRTENAPWPSSWTSLEALTARFDSLGYQVDGRLRPRVEGAG